MALVAVVLNRQALEETLENAYFLAIGDDELPQRWLERAEKLGDSPAVAFIAAFGATLLAKATNPNIDAFVIKTKEGGPGAFNLRSSATVLASRK